MESFIIDETSESFEVEKRELIESGDYSDTDLFFKIDGRQCKSKQDFFSHISAQLHFPEHFSDNWDSFNDCLQDALFETEKNVFIYVNFMGDLLEKDKKGLFLFYDVLYTFREEADDEPFVTVLFNFD